MANNAAVAAIKAAAAKYGIDPQAMLAVSKVESGLNPKAIGDGGHAFGLFQFNNAGGVITGQAHPERYLDPNFNAMEAARHISTIPGIRNATGADAVKLIVNNFERPADKAGEINKALSNLGSFSPGTVSRAATYANLAGINVNPSQTAPNASSGGGQGKTSYDPTEALMGYLTKASVPGHGTSDPTNDLLTLLGNNQASLNVETPTGTSSVPVQYESMKAPDKGSAKIVGLAEQYLGVKYKWGGTNPQTGFDCSGFIQFVNNLAGNKGVPRTTYQQLKAGSPVSKDSLQPGDAVFFNKGEHVGMYIGNGKFIQAPHTGDVVKISDLNTYPGFYTARRFGK